MKTEPRLTFGEALINGLFIHKNDEGRSRRSEFWWCALFLFIASTATDVATYLLQEHTAINNEYIGTASILANVYFAGAFSILLRRRLNDTGKPRLFYVFILLACATFLLAALHCIKGNGTTLAILIAAGILTIISLAACLWQCTRDSEMFSNRYGKSPKYVDEFADVYIEMPTVD